MARCPHCEYEGEAVTFEFESIRADSEPHEQDRGVITCPNCGATLGGYSYRDLEA